MIVAWPFQTHDQHRREGRKDGVKRAHALGYKSFRYCEHLIRKDVEERPEHVTVLRGAGARIRPRKKKARGSSAA
jgi:hypothetical protein